MQPVLCGIDLGTSSLKVVLTDAQGHAVSAATSDYALLSPAPGIAEQEPPTWWAALKAALATALRAARSDGRSMRAIGLSGQMHGIVALDKHDQPVRPAMLWADQRGAAHVAMIEQRIDRQTLLQHTGSRASVSFSAPKIMWLRQHEPQSWARCTKIVQPKDWLRLRLTGDLATEPTDASATLLFELAARNWSDLLLDRFDIPRSLLPPVVPSMEPTGVISRAAADELGIPAGIPVIAGAGDTPAQAIGYGVVDPGLVLATISSGGQLFAATGEPQIDPQGRVHALCHVQPDRWYVLGAIQAAGLALRWLRDLLAPTQSFDQLIAEAAQIPPGADGLIFVPYLLGERTPHLDNTARGMVFGLTLQHTRAALVRAVLEGVGFAFRDALHVFRAMGLECNEVRMGGGGSRSALWRGIFADVLDIPVALTSAEHGAAHGAALMAGVSSGVFPDLYAATATIRVIERHAPNHEQSARYAELHEIYRELYARNRDLFGRLD